MRTTALTLAPAPADGVPADGVPVDADAPLVRRAQAGDRKAFAELFTRHHARVRAMCARMLADASEVDDAVQQAFLEAWRCLPRFEGRSRFTTWITRVAIHTCFSTRRRLKRLIVSTLATDAADAAATAPVWADRGLSADEVASRHARERAVNEVLAQLSPKKRAVFVLADLEGRTSTEIAEILEIPDATVRTRLFHARKDVAALVQSHPGFVDLLAGRSHGAARDRARDRARDSARDSAVERGGGA